MFEENDDEDEDTAPIDVRAALRQAFNTEVEPYLPGFWIGALANFIIGPLIAWAVFSSAGILPNSVSGYLSVVMVVLLFRLCIMDSGLAKVPYIQIDPQTGDNNDRS